MRGSGKSPRTGFAEGRSSAKKSTPRDPVSKRDDFYKTNRQLLSDVVDDDTLARLDEQDALEANRFEKEFRKLRKKTSASNDNFNAESLNRLMLRAMLTMVLDVIPIAEEAYRKSKKESAAYALNSLLNQARELSLDLKLAKDVSGQAEFIQSKVLTPVFTSFTQLLIQEIFALKNTVDTEAQNKVGKPIKAQIDKMARSLGKYQTEMIAKIGQDIESFLNGSLRLDGTTVKPSRKK